MSRPLLVLLQCLAAIVAVGNLCVLGAWLRKQVVAAQKPAEAAPSNVTVEKENKTVVIKLNARAAESFGVATEAARPGVWRERLAVFGRVVPNPKATYEVRCPFPGTLQSAGSPWPTQGQTVRSGQPLARVTVRVAPADRLDLLVRLSDARLKKSGAEDVVRLRQNLVMRLTKVSAGAVAQRELEDAQVQLVEAQTQLKTATESVDIWEKALEEIDAAKGRENGPWTRTLLAPDVGPDAVLEVAEIAGQPGTAVEAGGLVVRLVDVSRPLVRLDLPAEFLHDGPPPAEVELSLAALSSPALRGASNRPEPATSDAPMRAQLVGPVAQADVSSQFIGYFYAPRPEAGKPTPNRLWRPGVFVQANPPLPSESPPDAPNAVVVPAGAVLYHQGRALVYICPEEGKYERREVRILGFRDDRAYLDEKSLLSPPTVGITAGDKVVSSGAQVLLSTEFRRDTDDD